MSAQPLDTRMARLEGAYEQISKRLEGIDHRLGSLQEHTDNGLARLDNAFARLSNEFARLEQKVDRQFFWVVGLLIVSILLPLSGRVVPH